MSDTTPVGRNNRRITGTAFQAGVSVVGDVLGRLKTEVLFPAMTVIFAAGILLFLWGMVKFIWNVDGGEKEQGKQHMIYGLIGMFIMVSFWAIIGLLDNTLNLGLSSGGASVDPGRNQIQGVNFGSNQ